MANNKVYKVRYVLEKERERERQTARKQEREKNGGFGKQNI